MKAFVIKPEDLTGYIKGFPIEIVQRMIEYQVEQGNKPNIEVFQNNICPTKNQKGFDWDATKEGFDFWDSVVLDRNFNLYFKTYPKQKHNIMQIPCYFVKNEKEYEYIKNTLKSIGYETRNLSRTYNNNENLIVLNFINTFGQAASLMDDGLNSIAHGRYVVQNMSHFIYEAARLQITTYKEHKKEIMKKPVESDTVQEPKMGDKVLVRDNSTVSFVTRIYIGKIHGKYACVNPATEESYNNGGNFSVKLWNEMVPKLVITKQQIAEKFDVSVDRIEITD